MHIHLGGVVSRPFSNSLLLLRSQESTTRYLSTAVWFPLSVGKPENCGSIALSTPRYLSTAVWFPLP